LQKDVIIGHGNRSNTQIYTTILAICAPSLNKAHSPTLNHDNNNIQ
jgi:hypothetical protein